MTTPTPHPTHIEAVADAAASSMSKEDAMPSITVLTAACRFTGLDHAECAGSIYLGSIFGEPTPCECECHKEGS